MRKLSIIFASFLFPAPAFAHTGDAGHDLAYGFAHPIGGLDHMLAMVAVGLLAAMLGGRAILWVPLCFIAMMVVGFVLGTSQVGLPLVEVGIALSVIAIGGAVTVAGSLPLATAMLLVGVFSVFHGYAHGLEAPTDASGMAVAAGFVASTALLHALGVAVTLALFGLSDRHGKSIVRTAGSAIVLGGVGLLFGWL